MQRKRTLISNSIKEHQALGLMLLLALIMGITFLFVVPPWQHYDEPTQFEYTWLVANRPELPEVGDSDQALRREIASSMIEHGFFRDLGSRPNLLSFSEQIWIGIPQIGSKPLYYWFAALPLRLFQSTDVTFQLHAARFMSLLFYLVIIVAAYGITGEITPTKHLLRWLLPVSILLLPSFVDILTAINDDVAATAFFSLFLWAGARMMMRGFNWLRLFALIFFSLICFFTKNTVMVAVILAPIPLIFSLIRAGYKRYAWIAITVGVMLGILLVFDFGFPRNWYLEAGDPAAVVADDEQAPLGKKVFAFDISEDVSLSRVSQLIQGSRGDKPKTLYTVGAWIWADQPAAVQTPTLHTTQRDVVRQVEVGREPQFFTFTEIVGAQFRPYKVSLSPTSRIGEDPLTVYYDGIVLLEGDWVGDIPEFSDASGSQGNWGGRNFTNLIRNPSGEYAGFTLRTWIADALLSVIPGNPALTIGLLQDPTPLVPYYKSAIKMLFHTFWARFGWAQVTLVGYRPYTILGFFTLAGIIGAAAAFWRSRKQVRWELFIFLGLALVSLWGAALLRGVTSYINGGYFIPVARYAFPVIIPSMLILNTGWLEIMRWLENYLKIPQRTQLWILITFFVLLDILSIYSIYTFYSG